MGKFLPREGHLRYEVIQWLMWQMGGLGPMMGQANHFVRYSREKLTYAIDRYTSEANRLTGVLDKQLAKTPYVAGEYSIADVATYPWVARYEWHKTDLNDFPAVKRWFDTISARPAEKKGMAVPQ